MDTSNSSLEGLEEKKEEENLPNMRLSHMCFLYSHEDSELVSREEKEELKKDILKCVEEDNMTPFYLDVCRKFGWAIDQALVAKMKEKNEETLKTISEKIEFSEKNEGEAEILEQMMNRLKLAMRTGDKEEALKQFAEIRKKSLSTTQKIELLMDEARLGMFSNDLEMMKAKIKDAKTMVDDGGDWDKRNRIKVYEGLLALQLRDFKTAATLFLDVCPTFASTECCTYQELIFYAVVTNIMIVDRVVLYNKVVKSPEIISMGGNIPYLKELLHSLYNCKYRQFFEALVGIHDGLRRNMYFSMHVRYIVREMRLLAYIQFIESYRSVTLSSMAESFGVSETFLDKELSRFISGGRIPAKIDKVGGIIESMRPDSKNASYSQVIKQGDVLLNSIQKLARFVNVDC